MYIALLSSTLTKATKPNKQTKNWPFTPKSANMSLFPSIQKLHFSFNNQPKLTYFLGCSFTYVNFNLPLNPARLGGILSGWTNLFFLCLNYNRTYNRPKPALLWHKKNQGWKKNKANSHVLMFGASKAHRRFNSHWSAPQSSAVLPSRNLRPCFSKLTWIKSKFKAWHLRHF